MTNVNNQQRRQLLKGIGGVAGGIAIAGCTGNNGGGGGNNGGGGNSGGTKKGQMPSLNAKMGIVAKELNQIPSIHALQSMLPETTNDKLGGNVRTFKNSSLPMQALVSGNLDYYALSFGNVIQAHLAGNDVITLGPKLTGTDYQFVIREEIKAQSLEEVVNGDYTIGVAGLGGLSHTQVAGVLAQEGLTTDVKEAGITSIGGSDARTSAIASGKIEATAIHIDQVHRLKSQNAGVKVLFDFREYYPKFINQTFTVTKKFLESEKGAAHTRKYMQRVVEAHEAATKSFDFVYSNMGQYVPEKLEEKEARKSWKFNAKTIKTWKSTKDGYSNESFKKYIQALNAANVLKEKHVKKIKLDEIINHELWDQAVDKKKTSQWLEGGNTGTTTSG